MAITRDIAIDGREVPFRASAAIPRAYRAKYRRDIFADLERIAGALEQAGDGTENAKAGEIRLSELDIHTLETFENIAHMMAKHADPAVPESIEAWLDGFNTFSIYQILPQIIELWAMNTATEAEAKKNLDKLTAR